MPKRNLRDQKGLERKTNQPRRSKSEREFSGFCFLAQKVLIGKRGRVKQNPTHRSEYGHG